MNWETTNILICHEHSLSLYLFADGEMFQIEKQEIPYSIKQMRRLRIHSMFSQCLSQIDCLDFLVFTTDDSQLVIMSYSKEQGIFTSVFFSSLPDEEEITGDYLEVDETGRFLLVGMVHLNYRITPRIAHELLLRFRSAV